MSNPGKATYQRIAWVGIIRFDLAEVLASQKNR
jgi:hypothetical protein